MKLQFMSGARLHSDKLHVLPRAWMESGSACLVVILLCALGLFSVLHLKKADFSIPLSAGWDAYFNSAWVKNVVEGHYNLNPHLGAPGIQEMYDFPLPIATHWMGIRAVSLFSHNFAVVINAYFLLTFPLIAIVSLATFRQFGMSYPPAILGGVLFAFLPYHLIRAESHLAFSSYYMVPAMVLVLLWLCSGTPIFSWDTCEPRMRWVTNKGLASLLICALVASDTPYQAFFGAFFLVVAGALARFRYGHRNLRSSAILLCTLLLVFSLNLMPSLIYERQNGPNPEPFTRLTEEAEIYGLKMAQLLLPVSGHRNHAMQKLKNVYNQRSFPYWVNENDWGTLGLIGSCGFIALMVGLFLRPKNGGAFDLFESLSLLNLSAFLLGTVGGIGALFAILVSKNLRAYNRISPFIAFFSLFAIAFLFDLIPRFREGGFVRFLSYPIIGALLVLGVWDQTTANQAPNYGELQKEFASDSQFIERIEASLPSNAMIFQLPYVAFPEAPPVNRMYDYDHLRAYLHSKNLRWSYGTMKGRDVDRWQRRVSSLPPSTLAETLTFAGFKGIYLNRDGYSDRAATLEAELISALGAKPLISNDQRLEFFDLTDLGRRLHSAYPDASWELMHERALAPLR